MTCSGFKQHLCGYLATLTLLALASCSGGGGEPGVATSTPGGSTTTLAAAQELTNTFSATLTGSEEIPPTLSTARGSGTIVVDPGTRVASVTVSTSGIVGTVAQIQEGAPGVSGPVISSLKETVPGSGVWSTKLTFTEAQFSSLQAGILYFNVLSSGFPTGEIRGQILSQQAIATTGNTGSSSSGSNGNTSSGLGPITATPTTFIATLRGSQETPPNSSTAQGSAAVVADADRRSLVVAVTTSGIFGTAAHIHSGQPGVAGPIVVPLVETPAGSGIWTATTALSDTLNSALTSGGLYLNVHSSAFPEGEIRGQILPVQQSVSNSTGTGAGLPSATGTGNTGAGLTGTGTTGAGTTGAGLTGAGLTGTGLPGTGTNGIGTNGIGTTTGIGTTGIGTTGIGTTGIGATGIGATDIGTTGIGSTGIGTTGTGLTGTGLTGTGTNGIGTTGLTGTGTTGTGLTGTGLTGTGTTGTGLTGTGTAGTGLTGTGTTGPSLTGTGITGSGSTGPTLTGTGTTGTGLTGTGMLF